MRSSTYELDMTKGPIAKNILRFAIPYMLTTMIQLFYNAADLVVVSRWSGSTAMASVGATSAVTNLLLNLFLGMSVGASVVLARCYGAHDDNRMHRAVHTTVLFAVILGVSALILGQIFCKPLLMLMDTPEGKVLDGAVLYMRIIFLGTPATLVYNFGAATLRAVGDTKRPLYILSVSGIANVLLNIKASVFEVTFQDLRQSKVGDKFYANPSPSDKKYMNDIAEVLFVDGRSALVRVTEFIKNSRSETSVTHLEHIDLF